MTRITRRIWGWWFFDWASQPYNTLLLTFIFAPYVKELLGDGGRAQAAWGYGIGAAGLVVALGAPLLGAVADRAGGTMAFIWLFSAMYVAGAWLLWYAAPGHFNLPLVMLAFGIGLVGMEFATIFTNAMLPGLGPADAVGRISGSGWAFGYVGGLVALVLMLGLFQIDPATGRTLAGLPPLFGLDPAAREGTRIVGPLTAVWYAVFMVPFFAWVREAPRPGRTTIRAALAQAWPDLRASLRALPAQRSLAAYLAASMLYRDALNGLYVFGGIYAAGVLGWGVAQVGAFGIVAIVAGALFAFAGGRWDSRYGPRPVIVAAILALTLTAAALLTISREGVLGIAVARGSVLPDLAFTLAGVVIGGAGGALQSASRTMVVRQADPGGMAQAFGIYALAGKATSFLAPLSIGIATDLTGSQSAGLAPLIALFLAGLGLLAWVKPQGERMA